MMDKKKKRPASIILVGLMGMIVACILLIANSFLESHKKRLLDDMEVGLTSRAANQTALLAVWTATIYNQIEAFIGQKVVQRFVYHVNASKASVEDVQTAADSIVASHMSQTSGDADSEDKSIEWKILLPRVKQEFVEFAEQNTNFYAASLANSDLEIYFAPQGEPVIEKEQQERMQQALAEGKVQILPAYRVDRRLIVDIVYPVRAPENMAEKEGEISGLFLCSCDITELVDNTDQPDEKFLFTSALLELKDKNLRLLDSKVEQGFHPLPDEEVTQGKNTGAAWEIGDGNKLPLAKRLVPSRIGKAGLPAYTLALPLPDTPWYLLQSVSESAFDEKYEQYKQNVVIACVLATALAGIFILAMWWWLIGRRERAVAKDMHELYQMVKDQKQILDGVNAALSAGVVLNDLAGTIYYANPSYAAMANMDPHHMHGMSYKDLPIDMARSLASHTNTVDSSGVMGTFTEEFEVGGVRHHYLTKSTPFLDEDNNMVGIVSVYSDVSDLVAAQARAQRMVTQTVAVFLRTIEAHDPYLGGHSFLAAELAVVLAFCLGVNDEETMDTLRTAASLSQIGMIHLPRQLLLKTGKLTPAERQFMQRHVQYAAAALQGIDFGLPVLPAIVQMYERLDGSGYPNQLSGDQICFNARILAVANTFVALMRPRSYRSPHTVESALAILNGQPPKYDPQIVGALSSYLATENGRVFLKKLLQNKQKLAEGRPAQNGAQQNTVAQAKVVANRTAAGPAQG